MKKIMFSLVLSQVIATSVLAENICSNQNEVWDGTRCATVAAGAVTAASSGIYSAKKYSEANSIVKMYTVRLFQHTESRSGENIHNVSQVTSNMNNGDRITITYNLSESENREHHIDLMKQNANSARTLAATYGAQALTATKSEQYQIGIDAQGRPTYATHQVADTQMRAYYGAQALLKLSEASSYDAKAAEARAGGPVPTYEFVKVVDSKIETSRLSSEVIQEKISRGGRVLSVDRLPVERFNMVKSVVGLGRAGLIGVAVGAAFATEEAISGMAAKKLNKRDGYSPSMNNWSN